jgi:hypothetical protein
MKLGAKQPSPEAKETMRALRRAARNALELGLKTGTPVWVVENNKLFDLTKEQRPSKKSSAKRSSRRTTRTKS